MDKNFDEFMKIGSEAVKSLNNSDTYNFFQCVGKLKYIGFDDYALILTSCYFFKIKEYARCLDTLNDIYQFTDSGIYKQLKLWYWDYKINSLAYLHKFEEIRTIFFEGEAPFEDEDIDMTVNSYVLAKYLSYKSGFEDDGVGIYRPDHIVEVINAKDDKFKAFFILELGKDLLEIYVQNEERLLLKSLGIEKNIKKELKNQLIKRIQKIIDFTNDQKYFEIDTMLKACLEKMRNMIKQDKSIDGLDLGAIIIPCVYEEVVHDDVITWGFVIEYLASVLETKKFLELFENEVSFVKEKLELKNEIIAKEMLSLCRNPKIGQSKCNDISFTEYWTEQINSNIPGYLENNKVYSINLDIYNNLSGNSKWAYEAAIWQYEQFVENGGEMKDAGLLSLSFMRLLETEINSRFIKPIHRKLKEQNYNIDKDGEFKKIINLTKLLTLGELRFCFQYVRENDTNDRNIIYNILLKDVLTEDGVVAFKNGAFEDILSQRIIDKFRNPPAHSRYLYKQEAVNAKRYVEDKLIELFKYTK